jgi:hypothetical protein
VCEMEKDMRRRERYKRKSTRTLRLTSGPHQPQIRHQLAHLHILHVLPPAPPEPRVLGTGERVEDGMCAEGSRVGGEEN